MAYKYFIEQKVTHLWWFPELCIEYHSTFDGGSFATDGFKDGWTNNPNHIFVGFGTEKEAQDLIDAYGVKEPAENLIITEHEFVNPH